MKRKKLIGFLGVISFLLVSPSAFATNGYQLIGIGSYQKSLGGAVTALPGSNMIILISAGELQPSVLASALACCTILTNG